MHLYYLSSILYVPFLFDFWKCFRNCATVLPKLSNGMVSWFLCFRQLCIYIKTYVLVWTKVFSHYWALTKIINERSKSDNRWVINGNTPLSCETKKKCKIILLPTLLGVKLKEHMRKKNVKFLVDHAKQLLQCLPGAIQLIIWPGCRWWLFPSSCQRYRCQMYDVRSEHYEKWVRSTVQCK